MSKTTDKEWNSQVAQRLAEIREHYPLEEQFSIWAYSVLAGKENVTREDRKYLVDLEDSYLKAKFEQYSAVYETLQKKGVGKNVQDWADTHTKYHSHNTYGLILEGGQRVKVSASSFQFNRTDYEKEYGLHQRIFLFLPGYNKTKISDVDKFIGQHTGNVLAVAGRFDISFPGQDDVETGLDIIIPKVDTAAIGAKAEALSATSVSDVTGFGNDTAIEAAAVVSKLSYYFTQQAAKPNHTLALVEDIIAEAKASANQQFVDSDPTWLERTFRSPQLVPADQMPLAELVQKAVALPNMAAVDNEALGKDLEIADHAMQVLGAYHQIIKVHKEALESEKDRLLKVDADKDDLISNVVGTGMSETVERTLQRLNGNMAFIKIFATNFFDISRLTAESRQNLSGIAGLAAVIQTPAMNAIGQHQAYQLRRFRQFGKAINDQVTEQFGAIASDITAQNNATPDNTQKAIEAALGTMIQRLEELPDKIMPVLEERTELAQSMQERLLDGAEKPTVTPA